ncbi:MAG: hypothetical protein KDD35_06905 [Bdellovibrionales bacterium]|nr:hypothetical protein [Bdellovibrionales bacterium]
MLRAMQLIFSFFPFVWIFPIISGCALFADNKEPPPSFGPREQVYYAEFDQVWRATQIALSKYPIKINNLDLGILETDTVKGYKAWMPPHKSSASGGLSYNINVRVVKGGVENRPAVRVTIIKEIELKRDFFAEVQRLPSDGLEERSLLYRIGRELQIDRALKKAQDANND